VDEGQGTATETPKLSFATGLSIRMRIALPPTLPTYGWLHSLPVLLPARRARWVGREFSLTANIYAAKPSNVGHRRSRVDPQTMTGSKKMIGSALSSKTGEPHEFLPRLSERTFG
jgi:hypothetical protein